MAKSEMQPGVSRTAVYERAVSPSSALLCFMDCLKWELAQNEQGGGFLIMGIPLLIVMPVLSVNTQCQHMSCQQMISRLLLNQICGMTFKYDFM